MNVTIEKRLPIIGECDCCGQRMRASDLNIGVTGHDARQHIMCDDCRKIAEWTDRTF